MRIVTKINTALGALIGLSVLLNWARWNLQSSRVSRTLRRERRATTMARILEAMAGFRSKFGARRATTPFGTTHIVFVNGELPDYLDTNITAEALRALNANFFAIVDNSGKLVVNEGYDFSGEEPAEAHLIAVATGGHEQFPNARSFRKRAGCWFTRHAVRSCSGRFRTDL